MPFYIKDADITTMDVDVIVNAANSRLARGQGVCGAIFAASDASALEAACRPLAPVAPGQAVATPSFGLKAPWIVHAVGPIWRGGSSREAQTLASCYRSALRAAAKLGATSIAFPLISSGIYGYPAAEARQVARAAILDELEATGDSMDVYLCLWGDRAQAKRALEPELLEYLRTRTIPDELLDASLPLGQVFTPALGAPTSSAAPSVPAAPAAPSTPAAPKRSRRAAAPAAPAAPAQTAPTAPAQAAPSPEDTGALFLADHTIPAAQSAPAAAGATSTRPATLEEALQHLDWGFSRQLLALIDARGLTDAQVYRKAGLTRQHFSKIRSNPGYQPRKQTVLALAFALELTLPETRDLLSRAGFALNPSSIDDAICTWYLERHMFDIDRVNQALYAYDRRLLGA